MRGNHRGDDVGLRQLGHAITFEVVPFLGDDEIGLLEDGFRIVDGLAVAVEEIGQTIGDVFRVERARLGIAQDGTRQVAGRNDDEAARSGIEDVA